MATQQSTNQDKNLQCKLPKKVQNVNQKENRNFFKKIEIDRLINTIVVKNIF